MREIVLDVETTGLSAKKGDRITEIGCVELVDKEPTGRFFNSYLNPEKIVSSESVKITGLTNEFLRDQPLFVEMADDFLEFIQTSPIIAHNASFDISFLNNELNLIGYKELNNNVIDTLKLARKTFPNKKNTLDALCSRYKIDLNTREKHGALLDAKLLAKVYINLSIVEDDLSFFDDISVENNEQSKIKINFIRRHTKVLTELDIKHHNELKQLLNFHDEQ